MDEERWGKITEKISEDRRRDTAGMAQNKCFTAEDEMKFPWFQTPIDLAHFWWQRLLRSGDCVIDATCGNGYDTLFLAEHVSKGRVIAIDNQPQAIEATRKKIAHHPQVEFHCRCHSIFPEDLPPASVSLIVYNLGYLPGGDKSLTTKRGTTLLSLQAALPLIRPSGAISITCYSGHEEGKYEEENVLAFASTLDPKEWSCCTHRWLNRVTGPTLLFIQRGINQSSVPN